MGTRVSGVLFFSGTDEALLAALATFRFLTIPQAVRLGIGGRENIGERLGRLRNAGYVGALGNSPLHGPRVHWLTKRGAEAASELLPPRAPLNVPSRAYRGGAHLRARVGIVDCHIALVLWARQAGYVLDSARTEFSRNPETLSPATTLAAGEGTYTPDAIFQLSAPDGRRRLLVLELERGGFSGSPDHFRAMMAGRAEVIRTFAVEKALDWPQAHGAARFLFVFAKPEMLATATRHLPEAGAPFWRSVYFKALPDVVSNFAAGWNLADGSVSGLF